MANKFREKSPIRTCTKKYTDYSRYKSDLANDFNSKCGYTDCSHFWFGGKNTFHIDHFKPFSKYPALKTDYSNLVYCCSYVNILKSNDEGAYIDPCDVDFNKHFERGPDGAIIPKKNSKEANYMYSKLQLGLARYKLIWKIDQISSMLDKLEEAIDNPKNSKIVDTIKITHSDLSREYRSYIRYLKGNL